LSGNFKFSSSSPLVNVHDRSGFLPGLRSDWSSRILTLDWTVICTLAILIVLGFGLRLNRLDEIGLAEDEMNKLDAIQAYERGDFSANSEHPMIMKMLMWGSLRSAPTNSQEIALRLPNVLIGALTVIPIFLLTAVFFDRWTALLAAVFWAVGINAITHNRIGKEDSLLVFFMLFAFYFFVRAKQISPTQTRSRLNNYLASAVSFGLMIASKYFPHYLGLNMIFHHNFHVRTAVPGEPTGRTPGLFFMVIALVFLVVSPAILLPEVWLYLNEYMGERLLSHSGYLFAGRLYKNNMSSSPFWGTPVYFYVLFLMVKVPIMILAGLIIGLAVSIKRRREVGYAFLLFMFFFWIVPYSLVGGKWLRYTLSVMPFVYMLAAVGVVALVSWLTSQFPKWKHGPIVFSSMAVALFVLAPAGIALANGPHYALYTNAFAPEKAGFYFPHDEYYDDGLREAIKYVCEQAPPGATIAHETPGVSRHYLELYGRTDLNSHPISATDFDLRNASGPVYAIVQRGRTYFENKDEIEYARTNFRKLHEVKVNESSAVEVFVNNAERP